MDDELITEQAAGAQPGKTELLLATVGNYNSSTGTTLIFDGAETATTKRYKRVGSSSLTAGSRVLVAKISGTYLILGRIY